MIYISESLYKNEWVSSDASTTKLTQQIPTQRVPTHELQFPIFFLKKISQFNYNNSRASYQYMTLDATCMNHCASSPL